MTFTHEEVFWAATRVLAWVVGAVLLCAIVIVIAVALTVAVKRRTGSRRG
ncbi:MULTISPECIES: hypothetical protein [unclassified Streptomyces]|nr:hypothetical protein [Streptomyces sp. NRRL S-241]